MSGNTFAARIWTDGKQDAPMLPHPPAVVRCRHCAEFYWLSDAEEIGTIDPWNSTSRSPNPAWDNAQEIEEPSADELYLAIEKNLARDRKEEKYLRLLAWWRTNDAYRSGSETRAEMQAESNLCQQNLVALENLLGHDKADDRLMKSEVLRELGRFEDARKMIAYSFPHKYRHAVKVISDLIDQRNTTVAEIQGNEATTDAELEAFEEEQLKRNASASALEIQLREAERAQQLKVKEGKACPRCGFSYAWNGARCNHCRFGVE